MRTYAYALGSASAPAAVVFVDVDNDDVHDWCVWQPERTFLICCNYMCFSWYYENFVHYNFALHSALCMYVTYTHNPCLNKWMRLWALAATPLSLLFYLIKSLTLCNFTVGILFQWTQREVDEVKTPRWGIKAYERAKHVFVAKAHSCRELECTK